MADPLWINCPSPGAAPQYTAGELRQAMALGGVYGGRALGARQGVRPGGTQWSVTLAGDQLTVNPGAGLVDPGLTTPQGPYWVALPLAETHTLTPAHATSPRKDLVVVRVYDTDEDASGLRLARSEYLEGVPAPSPSEPAVPAGAVRVALVDVPASGGGAAVVTFVAPYTVAPGGILPIRNAAEEALVVAAPGLAIYRLDGPGLAIFDGAAWRRAGVLLDFQNLETSTPNTSGTATTTIATKTVNVAGDQLVRVALYVRSIDMTVATDQFVIEITEDGANKQQHFYNGPTAGDNVTSFTVWWITPTPPAAGNHTYAATIRRTSGTGVANVSAAAGRPIQFTVETLALAQA
jgi:hypothetical protein